MFIVTEEFIDKLAKKMTEMPLFTEKIMDNLADKIAARLANHVNERNTVVKNAKKEKPTSYDEYGYCVSSCSVPVQSSGCGVSSHRRKTSINRGGSGCGSSFYEKNTGGC